ncbi:hypothetical protein [Gracilinema caldarium]|uniref:hypothetical protein n=1 Tax=Gracilinema caldarium TaxID=215591 RepID=UPI0026F0DD4B|nr:hypothetical protein [Gracilinema caldarium]
MKRILMNTALLLAVLLVFSCNQSPLFYNISKETPPKNPIIAGQPSKIVEFSGQLYAANGTVWVYAGSSWTRLASQPAGNVRDVAATTGALYALTVDGTGSLSTTLYKSTNGTSWTPVSNTPSYPILGGGLFGAGDTLFVGAKNSGGTSAAVLYDNNGSLTVALDNITTSGSVPGTLAGAVKMGTNYYLAVTGMGVYASSLTSFSSANPITGSTDTKYRLNGLIAVGNKVVAVGSGGYMLAGDSTTGFSEVSGACDTSYPYTGALAVWTDPSNSANKLLLVGRRYSTYTNGYWEIGLTTSGDLPGTVSLNKPGSSSPTTVTDKSTYEQSLGQKVLTALYQAPGGTLGTTLFASTLKDGLWAYRNGTWNAEE